MQKIPTVFLRDTDGSLTKEVNPKCQWVLDGEGVATRKYDGTCVLIRRDGLAVKAYARREVKLGKKPPVNFLAVAYDEATGKTVGWEPAAQSSYAKVLAEVIGRAGYVTQGGPLPGTYELCGPKVNGNPEGYETHTLIRHDHAETFGATGVPRGHEDLRTLVVALGKADGWEGLVWHHPDGRRAKLKARDFTRGKVSSAAS